MIGELLERHGHGAVPDGPADGGGDHSLLVADASEAYLVETAGRFWVYQEIKQVRAASNLCTIHQDWDRISPGLGAYAISQGWWPGDGSKLDFADALAVNPVGETSALRRWGRATLLLEQQNGHIDLDCMRRMLGDHYEGTHFEVDPLAALKGPAPLCQHGNAPGAIPTATSMIATLGRESGLLPIVACAFGPPCLTVYFPLFLEGALPEAFGQAGGDVHADTMSARIYCLNERVRAEPRRWAAVRERMSLLQEDFDREANEVAAEGADLKRRGEHAAVENLTTAFMQHNLELFDEVLTEFGSRVPVMMRQPAPAFDMG
jgi:dipeptidase